MPRSIREAIHPLFTKMFEHHSNPWSACTRLLSTPLVLVPFWTRSWEHPSLVSVWLAAQPNRVPGTHNDSAWPTRAMLGEEMRVAKRPMARR
jgi:hypothetical protein